MRKTYLVTNSISGAHVYRFKTKNEAVAFCERNAASGHWAILFRTIYFSRRDETFYIYKDEIDEVLPYGGLAEDWVKADRWFNLIGVNTLSYRSRSRLIEVINR